MLVPRASLKRHVLTRLARAPMYARPRVNSKVHVRNFLGTDTCSEIVVIYRRRVVSAYTNYGTTISLGVAAEKKQRRMNGGAARSGAMACVLLTLHWFQLDKINIRTDKSAPSAPVKVNLSAMRYVRRMNDFLDIW